MSWDHKGDNTGRFRGGKTASQRGTESARKARQQERGEYTRWCSSSASATASTETASRQFPWGACNGKRIRRLRERPTNTRAKRK